MKRVNVLFVMPQMGMGGSERLVHSLVLKLDRNQFNPSVAWFFGREVLKEFADLNVPLHFVPKTRRFDFPAMLAIRRVVQGNKIDVVIAQHFMSAVYAYYACKIGGSTPLVFVAHSRWEIDELPLRWKIVGGYLLRRIVRCVGVARDVSRAIQNTFRTHSNTETIENGVELAAFKREQGASGMRASFGIGPEHVAIGIVANLKRVKNHMLLLEAFAQVAARCASVKLLIVGQGFAGDEDNTEAQLREFVSSNGLASKVTFLGYRTDIPDILRVLDIFCLTSLKEGLPISIVEAMAVGLPIVCTNVEGIRDVVSNDEDAILVELGDVAALTAALLDLVGDRQKRISFGEAGRAKATRKYALQRCIHEYEKLIHSIVVQACPSEVDESQPPDAKQ